MSVSLRLSAHWTLLLCLFHVLLLLALCADVSYSAGPSPMVAVPPVLLPLADLLSEWSPDNTHPASLEAHVASVRSRGERGGVAVFEYSNESSMLEAQQYRLQGQPFVVRGFPSVARLAWTDEYLQQRFGPMPLRADSSPTNHFMWYSRSQAAAMQASASFQPPTADELLTFSQWRQMAAANSGEGHSNTRPHHYLQLSSTKGMYLPWMSDDLQSLIRSPFVPSYTQLLLSPADGSPMQADSAASEGDHIMEGLEEVFCRFSSQGTIAEPHFDMGGNLVYLVQGRRRVVLAPPDQCGLLHVEAEGPIARHSTVNWADAAVIDEFRQTGVQAVELVMEAGDLLFIPSYYFHYFITLERAAQCNYRPFHSSIGYADIQRCFGATPAVNTSHTSELAVMPALAASVLRSSLAMATTSEHSPATTRCSFSLADKLSSPWYQWHQLSGETDACGNACDDGYDDRPCCGAPTCYCTPPGGCVDVQDDNSNCGDCGTVCYSPTSCKLGSCCQGGLTYCTSAMSGTCSDLMTDPSNCGGCGNNVTPDHCCQGEDTDVQTDNDNCGSCGFECDVEAGKQCCGGRCLDMNTDNSNCGSCGNVCDTNGGEQCCSGTCINVEGPDSSNCGACGNVCQGQLQCVTGGHCGCSPFSQCGLRCRDLAIDLYNCGHCGDTCIGGSVCSSGRCQCYEQQSQCDGTCTDTTMDSNNCGGCGKQCHGAEYCWNSQCVCPFGTSLCGLSCVDTIFDDDNCGACGNRCQGNEECNFGSCELQCDGLNEADCGTGQCSDVSSDPNHCGACNIACGPTSQCVNGACQCPTGLTQCGTGLYAAQCLNLLADVNNCGACGRYYPGSIGCQNGEPVCSYGQALCNGACVDTTSSAYNCGGCGALCLGGAVCEYGYCYCPYPQQTCGGVCTNTLYNPNECGSCSTHCSASQSCIDGACKAVTVWNSTTYHSCGGPCFGGKWCCPTGCQDITTSLTDCGACGRSCGVGQLCCGASGCINPLTDSSNCGGCGRSCSAGLQCIGGKCVGGCQSVGLTTCGSSTACVSLQSDVNNCGSCGSVCSGSATCVSGSCVTNRCTAGQSACDGSCSDLEWSPTACGLCGTSCQASQVCSAGVCQSHTSVCAQGRAVCSVNGAYQCVNTTSDPLNCGSCGHSCTTALSPLPAYSFAFCAASVCYVGCQAGFVFSPTGGCMLALPAPNVLTAWQSCSFSVNPCGSGACTLTGADGSFTCVCPSTSPGGLLCQGCPLASNGQLCGGAAQGSCADGFCLCSLGYAGWDCGSLQAAITTGVAALQVLGPIPVNGSAPALIAGSNFIALLCSGFTSHPSFNCCQAALVGSVAAGANSSSLLSVQFSSCRGRNGTAFVTYLQQVATNGQLVLWQLGGATVLAMRVGDTVYPALLPTYTILKGVSSSSTGAQSGGGQGGGSLSSSGDPQGKGGAGGQSGSSDSAGAIAGGVIGGLVLAVLLVALVLLWRRHKNVSLPASSAASLYNPSSQHHPIASSGIKNPPPLPPRVAFSSPQLPTTSDPYAEPTAAQIAYPSSVQLAALPSPPPYQHQQPALPQQQQYADPYSDYSQAGPASVPSPSPPSASASPPPMSVADRTPLSPRVAAAALALRRGLIDQQTFTDIASQG